MSEPRQQKAIETADGVLFEERSEQQGQPAARLDESVVDLNDLAEEGRTALTERTAATDQTRLKGKGLTIPRYYTQPDVDPFDTVEWETRTATISSDKGDILFRQDDCKIPATWSQMATNVVVSKYFRGGLGTPDRETSVRQLIGRVADTITAWGVKDDYFATATAAEAFHAELKHMLVHQLAAFKLPGLVQRGRGEASPVLGLLHQLGRGQHDQHPEPGQD